MEFTSTLLFRRSFAQKASQLVVFFITIALVAGNLLVEQHIIFTWIGLADLGLSIVVWQLIARKRVTFYSAHLLIASCWVYLFPLIMLSGGVDSYFIYLVPLSPMMAGLLFDTRFGFYVCWFMLLNILVMFWLAPRLPNYADVVYDIEEQTLKAYSLMFATVIATVFVAYFHRFNHMMSRMLRDQAMKDPLTGIFNRRSLVDLMDVKSELAGRNGTCLSLLIIDIDDFKKINDRYGHNVGDICLKAVAGVLAKSLRRDTDNVGRWGGEEFLAIIVGVDAKKTLEIAEVIRRNIADLEIRVDNRVIRLSATIGCYSVSSNHVPPPSEMVKHADAAMYKGKISGKNQVRMSAGPSDQVQITP